MRTSKIKKIVKKITTSILVTTLLITGSGMQKLSVSAASAKEYVSDFKLYTGKLEEAKKTFSNYKFIENSLNGKSDGSDSVYLGYTTTTDKKDAVRDIAFMQMGGAYSISDYEKVLEDNAELARTMVEEYKCVVEEFRANYNSSNPDKKKLAEQAYTLLNKYYEEDTKLHMGDFFLNADGKVKDENYVTIVMQAPSTTRYALLNILAKGIDEDINNTWIDRLVSYNGFEGLCSANGIDANDDSARKQAMDKYANLYGDEIKYLTDDVETKQDGEIVSISAWDQFAQKLEKYADSLKESTEKLVEDVTSEEKIESGEELNEAINENIEDNEAFIYSSIYELLTKVEYKDGTLYDLFTTPSSDMKPEDFYPIIAALSEGQQTIMINNGFEILVSAAVEHVATSNNLESAVDIDKEEIENNMNADVSKVQEENVEEQEKSIEGIIDVVSEEADDDILEDIIKDDAISVYAGVDRSFFEKGVAMTSEASSSDESDDKKWDSKKILQLTSFISFGIGTACVISGACVISAGNKVAGSIMAKADAQIAAFNNESIYEEWGSVYNEELTYSENMANKTSSAAASAQSSSAAYQIAGKALIAIGLVLVTYSIVAQIISLVKKDNPHYTEIPKKMVDASNKEKTNMESFLYYDAVLNKDGEAQDLNNWTSGTWLAMYASKSKSAGGPILADSFKIQNNSNNTTGMKSAHLFGRDGAYNMLTYSKDNKSQSKLFMYFEKDAASNAGSIFGRTTVLATTILVALAAVVISFRLVYKKKKSEL